MTPFKRSVFHPGVIYGRGTLPGIPFLAQDNAIDHYLSNISLQVRGKVRVEEAELRKSHPSGTFLRNPKKISAMGTHGMKKNFL